MNTQGIPRGVSRLGYHCLVDLGTSKWGFPGVLSSKNWVVRKRYWLQYHSNLPDAHGMPTGCPRGHLGDDGDVPSEASSLSPWIFAERMEFFSWENPQRCMFSHVWQRRVSFSNFSITHCWTAGLYLVTILGRRRWAWSSRNFFVLCWFCQKPPLTWRRGGGWDWRLRLCNTGNVQLTDDFIGLHGFLVGFHQHLHMLRSLPSSWCWI